MAALLGLFRRLGGQQQQQQQQQTGAWQALLPSPEQDREMKYDTELKRWLCGTETPEEVDEMREEARQRAAGPPPPPPVAAAPAPPATSSSSGYPRYVAPDCFNGCGGPAPQTPPAAAPPAPTPPPPPAGRASPSGVEHAEYHGSGGADGAVAEPQPGADCADLVWRPPPPAPAPAGGAAPEHPAPGFGGAAHGAASASATAAATALAALAADRPLTWRDKPPEQAIDEFLAQYAAPESGTHCPEAAGQPSAGGETGSPRRQEHPLADGPAAGGEAAAAYDQQLRRAPRLPLDLRSATPDEMREEISVCRDVVLALQDDRDRCREAMYRLQAELDGACQKVERMGEMIEQHMAAEGLSAELEETLTQQVSEGEKRIAQLAEALRSAGVAVPSADPDWAAADVAEHSPPAQSGDQVQGAPSEQGGAERLSGTEHQIEELRAAVEEARRGWAAAEAALERERHQRHVPQQQQCGGGSPRDMRHTIRRLEAELDRAMRREADHEAERDHLRARLAEREDALAACERDLARLHVAHTAATRDYDHVLRVNDDLIRILDERQGHCAAEEHSQRAHRRATGRSSRTSVAGPVKYRVHDTHRLPSSVTSTLSPEKPEWLFGCPSQNFSSPRS